MVLKPVKGAKITLKGTEEMVARSCTQVIVLLLQCLQIDVTRFMCCVVHTIYYKIISRKDCIASHTPCPLAMWQPTGMLPKIHAEDAFLMGHKS